MATTPEPRPAPAAGPTEGPVEDPADGPADRTHPTAPPPAPAPAPPDIPHQAPGLLGVPPRIAWWRRPAVRIAGLGVVLALCGAVLLALVREETGTQGFLVGLGLAVLPVPLLIAAFRWLHRVAPGPWRNVVFCFAWGACAAALMSIVANSFATEWIAETTADPGGADTIGSTVIAPVVEETAKGAAILLIFLFRRREFTRLVDGVVIAGVTATGFAFTENILYLGRAFGDDQTYGDQGIGSVTVATFFARVVMSPFAHPLFTVLTGIGFGLAAQAAPRRRVWRALAPLGGLLLAMGLHALWNGSTVFGGLGFLVVYGAFMVPVFGLLIWLAVWARQRELRTVRDELPAYVAAGWLTAPEPYALGSLRARRLARDFALHHGGKPAARAVREYERHATALAFLRHRGAQGRAGADFGIREQESLDAMWARRAAARPALTHAALMTAPRPAVPHPYAPPYPGPHPAAYGHPPAYGQTPGYGQVPAYGQVPPYGQGYGYPGHGQPVPGHGQPGPGHGQPGPGYGYPPVQPGTGPVPGQGGPYGSGTPAPYNPYAAPGRNDG
ncbi:PrsW family intramembrane metalloprotease [Streptomyces uncialis]|uniref:PrsW family intramembrane metalloprotease n=1 Tax=Streptomyces uncialis TaxID=1048205 RepID=UPI0009A10E8E|nr:PrsW family intramembrane metalloprotease [Streptomyces uncialis]